MRGDRPDGERVRVAWRRFTPHARGSTRAYRKRFHDFEVYPACAGIDRHNRKKGRQIKVYPACAGIDLVFVDIVEVGECLPRMRGDRPADQAQIAFLAEFTPHARGSTLFLLDLTYGYLVYPACAGIDR